MSVRFEARSWRARCSVAGAHLPYNSAFMPGSCVGDREARTDGERRELIDRIAAGAPVRQLLLVELGGHARVPFAGYRPDHRGGVKLGHNRRAAEAAADLEAWLANPSSPNGAG